MDKQYKSKSGYSTRVNELPTVSATDLKNKIADVFEQVASGSAVAVTRHDKPRAVLMSIEEYRRLAGPELPEFDELLEEYRGLLAEMQSPEQKAAAKRLFEATPEELGEAALRGAQRQAGQQK